jgi:hypothetical protein
MGITEMWRVAFGDPEAKFDKKGGDGWEVLVRGNV